VRRPFLICLTVVLFLSGVLILFPEKELKGQMNLTALPDDPLSTEMDREFIRRSYEIARGAGADGGRPFGSVLVHEGKIIAECVTPFNLLLFVWMGSRLPKYTSSGVTLPSASW